MIDPSSHPINLWLCHSEPRVSEDDLVVTEVGEEVAQVRPSRSSSGVHVDVIL